MQRAIEHFLRFPSPPSYTGDVTKNGYHYYVASLTRMVENELKPSELRALTPLTAGGLNMYFFYHEYPRHFVIDGFRNLVMLTGIKGTFNFFSGSVGQTLMSEDLVMPAGFPFRLNLSTKAWRPSRLPWDCIDRHC